MENVTHWMPAGLLVVTRSTRCCFMPIRELPSEDVISARRESMTCPGPPDIAGYTDWIPFGTWAHLVAQAKYVGIHNLGYSVHVITACEKRLTTDDYSAIRRNGRYMRRCPVCLNQLASRSS